MNWLKQNPLLCALLVSATLVVGVEGWMLWRTRLDAAYALASLDQKKREREELQHRLPPPTSESVRATAEDLARASAKLAEARAPLSKREVQTGASLSVESIDAYFEIARFVESQRAAAKRRNIALKPDEHFGFRSYATEGPDTPILSAVLRQRVAIEELIEALFAAGPVALIGIQRERPVPVSQLASPEQGRREKNVRAKLETRRDEAADFFEPVRSISLRVPGKIGATAFSLEFSGPTPVLRDFLYALASSGMPFFVRSVEAEPLVDLPKSSIAAGASSVSIPIVTNSLSRFRVTVELLESVRETEGVVR